MRALDPVRWPFDAERLRHLPRSHVYERGQAPRTACPDGEGDQPCWGDLNADHTGVRHPILRRHTVEAVPSDVLERPAQRSVTGRHRLLALATSRSAGGVPDEIVGVKSDRVFPPACRVAATVGFDHGQVDGDVVLRPCSALHPPVPQRTGSTEASSFDTRRSRPRQPAIRRYREDLHGCIDSDAGGGAGHTIRRHDLATPRADVPN